MSKSIQLGDQCCAPTNSPLGVAINSLANHKLVKIV